jgi:hypothetical protein
MPHFDSDDTHLLIREAGGCPEDDDWLISYPFREVDARGRASFRIDSAVHDLCPGLYDGVVFVGCDPCGVIRIDTTKRRPFATEAPKQTALQAIPEPAAPLEGRETMYDPYVGFSAQLNCAVSAVGGLLRIDADLPSPTPSPPPQLVLRDGVNAETVTLLSANEGVAFVERGSPAYAFSPGTVLQFEWTTDNVLAASAGPDLISPSKGSGAEPASGDEPSSSDSGTGGCLTFEGGKGIKLTQSDSGTIKVELETTGVVAGEHNGIEVDECGRIVVIDESFPDIPVFDGCCKEEAGE